MSLLELVKQAGVGAVEAGKPAAVLFGTVTKASPLEVNVDQRFTITEDFLIIPESLKFLRACEEKFPVSLKGNFQTGPVVQEESEEQWTGDTRLYGQEVAMTRGEMPLAPLEAGDKLILLRVQGGQQYVILDRVG
ncbi:DUF2577 domain-containing protein [Desulforamulus ruminis]|uniref:DUF2577 domain-containing protein n=1 Tax=Desulforamulus ruminis TaxID=1564 RepID=UPI002353DBA1|nr:DUF2577 domain-containing protein [Desulforamulus ruminis]